MKIRTGFVSNSSSSSFLLIFEEIPTFEYLKKSLIYDERAKSLLKNTKENIIKIDRSKEVKEKLECLFRGMIYDAYGHYPQENFIIYESGCFDHTRYVIETLLGEEKYNELKELYHGIYEIRNSFTGGFSDEKYKEIWQKSDEIEDMFSKELYEKILEKYEGKYFSIVSYSDNDGSFYSDMEHSGCLEDIGLLSIRRNEH